MGGAVRGPFIERSIRLIIRPTLAGTRVRVRLSNRFGLRSLRIDSATIAQRAYDATLVPNTLRRLRFGGKRFVTIPPSGEVRSDSRRFSFPAGADLAITLYVRSTSGGVSTHFFALQTSFTTSSGDHTRDEAGEAFTESINAWPLLSDLETRTRHANAVVLVGDSITDGIGSAVDANQRYSDFLATRLEAAGMHVAVQNAGIGGNRILSGPFFDGFGPSLLDRLTSDVLDQSGVRTVVLMEGTNDLVSTPPATASELIAGLQTTIYRMHQQGLRVLLGTQTPAKNTRGPHGTPTAIATRNQVNDWIRTTAVVEGVVDFHAALRDPLDPDRLRDDYNSGDNLHPNAAGFQAMAEAVDLSLLAPSSACP